MQSPGAGVGAPTGKLPNKADKMMIKVLGRPNSVNVQKVMWCAGELGLNVDRADIGGAFGGTDTDEFGALNPNRTVPVLLDGDFSLYESNAIVRYLCATYGGPEWSLPTGTEKARAEQWMDWYLTTLHPPMTALFWQLVRTPEEERDQAKVDAAIAECTQKWSILERHLEDRAFVLGDTLSMADIPVGCSAYRWHCMDFNRPELPNLRRWWDSLVERETYKTGVMVPIT